MSPGGAFRPATSARGEVDRGDLAGLDPERRVDVLCRRAGPDHDEVGLVHVAGVPDVPGDHLQAPVATNEPAADPVTTAQRLCAVADVDPHLGRLVHQSDRAFAIATVELFEEDFHRVDGTHGSSVV